MDIAFVDIWVNKRDIYDKYNRNKVCYCCNYDESYLMLHIIKQYMRIIF